MERGEGRVNQRKSFSDRRMPGLLALKGILSYLKERLVKGLKL